MPQLVKKRRSGWAVLAAGALVASLLAVAASPAGAINQHEDELTETWRRNTEVYGACPAGSDAVADHGFTDVSDEHAFQDVINCVAYYGITNGTDDGATFSPNDEVTRAEMAVFIARAAEVAGVSVGSGSGGFSDIGDVWQEAQDAINGLASMGMIPSGGEFRPEDDITRAEMAAFLIGLLAEGASNVTIDQDGVILLGATGSAEAADDYFADARSAVPRAIDAQISALYELGVTKGASAIPGGAPPAHVLASTYNTAIVSGIRNLQGSSIGNTIPLTLNDDGNASFSVSGLTDLAPLAKADKWHADIRVQHSRGSGPSTTAPPPLPYNYEPHGTVNRGQMAAFITRALAHTDARPEGITAQFAGGNVVVSVRDENFAPVSNVVVDLFRIDTPGLDLAFRADGSCNEAGPMDSTSDRMGEYTCEIDNVDHITGGGGDVRVPLGDKVDTGGTTVWIWTGDDEDEVDDDATLFRLDVSEAEAAAPAVAIKVTTEHGGEKAHLGSSVIYTAQLVDKDGNDVGDPDRWYKPDLPFTGVAQFNDSDELVATGGEFKVGTLPIYTADPGTGSPVATGQAAVADGSATAPTGSSGAVIFSTEAGIIDAGDINVKVEPAAEFAVVDTRGANNRVKVTVTDQYGDPIPGVQVRVDSRDDSTTNNDASDQTVVVVANRYLSVGRDGSFSFGYESFIEDSSREVLVATISGYDHDGDGCSADDVAQDGDLNVDPPVPQHRCNVDGPDVGTDPDGTAPLLSVSNLTATVTADDGPTTGDAAGQADVKWAVAADADQATLVQVRAFDTEMNTIFVGGNTDGQFVAYDSNDRFNIDRPEPDPDPEAGVENVPTAPASYGAFEKALSKATGYMLTWEINGRGSRATNVFTLYFPDETVDS